MAPSWFPLCKAMQRYCEPYFSAVRDWREYESNELLENRIQMVETICRAYREFGDKQEDFVFDILFDNQCILLKDEVFPSAGHSYVEGGDKLAFTAAKKMLPDRVFIKAGIFFQNNLLKAIAGWNSEILQASNMKNRKSVTKCVTKFLRLSEAHGFVRLSFKPVGVEETPKIFNGNPLTEAGKAFYDFMLVHRSEMAAARALAEADASYFTEEKEETVPPPAAATTVVSSKAPVPPPRSVPAPAAAVSSSTPAVAASEQQTAPEVQRGVGKTDAPAAESSSSATTAATATTPAGKGRKSTSKTPVSATKKRAATGINDLVRKPKRGRKSAVSAGDDDEEEEEEEEKDVEGELGTISDTSESDAGVQQMSGNRKKGRPSVSRKQKRQPNWTETHPKVGTAVAAYFPPNEKPFTGEVTKYSPPSREGAGDQLYRILWDDGDEQDYDEDDLQKGIDLLDKIEGWVRDHPMVGTKIAKNFPAGKRKVVAYKGEITKYMPHTVDNEETFHVVYDDGDEENATADEIAAMIELYKSTFECLNSHKKKRKLCSPSSARNRLADVDADDASDAEEESNKIATATAAKTGSTTSGQKGSSSSSSSSDSMPVDIDPQVVDAVIAAIADGDVEVDMGDGDSSSSSSSMGSASAPVAAATVTVTEGAQDPAPATLTVCDAESIQDTTKPAAAADVVEAAVGSAAEATTAEVVAPSPAASTASALKKRGRKSKSLEQLPQQQQAVENVAEDQPSSVKPARRSTGAAATEGAKTKDQDDAAEFEQNSDEDAEFEPSPRRATATARGRQSSSGGAAAEPLSGRKGAKKTTETTAAPFIGPAVPPKSATKAKQSSASAVVAKEEPMWTRKHDSVGTKVAQYFPCEPDDPEGVPRSKFSRTVTAANKDKRFKPYRGRVTKYLPPTREGANDQLYHIRFEDDDEEDWDQKQLETGVARRHDIDGTTPDPVVIVIDSDDADGDSASNSESSATSTTTAGATGSGSRKRTSSSTSSSNASTTGRGNKQAKTASAATTAAAAGPVVDDYDVEAILAYNSAPVGSSPRPPQQKQTVADVADVVAAVESVESAMENVVTGASATSSSASSSVTEVAATSTVADEVVASSTVVPETETETTVEIVTETVIETVDEVVGDEAANVVDTAETNASASKAVTAPTTSAMVVSEDTQQPAAAATSLPSSSAEATTTTTNNVSGEASVAPVASVAAVAVPVSAGAASPTIVASADAVAAAATVEAAIVAGIEEDLLDSGLMDEFAAP